MVKDVVRELKLTKDQQQMLHRELGEIGEEMTYHEILDLARNLFGK